LRWNGSRWEVKDLSSRNGTFVEDATIERGGARELRKGMRIAFGTALERWELTEDDRPCAMAMPIEGGDPVLVSGELLAVPSSDDPRVTIYRDLSGSWVLEQPDESAQTIKDAHVFESAGRWWRFCCPDDVAPPTLPHSSTELLVRQLQLSFAVSSDEEYVELRVSHEGRRIDMGVRARNYLLLTLARRRVEDAREGASEANCGWICQSDFPHDPIMAAPQLNLDVYRLRKQFAAAGVIDAHSIIERRPLTRELRIGTDRISIQTLG
jgi:hypothetical protein